MLIDARYEKVRADEETVSQVVLVVVGITDRWQPGYRMCRQQLR